MLIIQIGHVVADVRLKEKGMNFTLKSDPHRGIKIFVSLKGGRGGHGRLFICKTFKLYANTHPQATNLQVI